jgi:protein-S-isoprenylcysteine O-methyltransferase Ste14
MPWTRIDIALWGLLAVVWVVAAPFSRKTVRREAAGSRLRYLAPVVIVAALLSPELGLPGLGARWLPDAPWVGAVSVIVTATGIAFALWARFALGKNWSGTVTVKEDHELVQSGPYALARHPIYTGGVIAFVGTGLAFGTIRAALCVVPLLLALRFKMGVEERFMGEQFGEAYAAYRQRVKALIPFVW